jgi:hypothetical protein
MMQFESDGMARDEAFQAAIDALAESLSTTEEDIVNQIQLSQAETFGALGDVRSDLDAISELMGKPAREVTLEDTNFVAEIIAQQNILDDPSSFVYTADQLGYDVSGDGVVDATDLNLLNLALSGEQTFFDPGSDFAATGYFGELEAERYARQQDEIARQRQRQADLDAQAALDAQTALDSQTALDVQTARDLAIATETANRQALEQGQQMYNTLTATDTVRVDTPDVAEIDYLYDFEDIFANPEQARLFGRDYGDKKKSATGGLINNDTDELLRILGKR